MAYVLGVDLGTTFTAAAIGRDARTEIVQLGTQRAAVESVVVLREDGATLVGEPAARRAQLEPERAAREFKRRLGDTTPMVVSGLSVTAEQLLARLLRWAVEKTAANEGAWPERVVVTYPASWGPYKRQLLDQTIRMAEIPVPVRTMTEPEAAALHYASSQRVAPGEVVLVYDLGGGTFDAAVVRRTELGFELRGESEGLERLGGIDFDHALLRHVLDAAGVDVASVGDDAETRQELTRLREDCIAAKEALSADTETQVAVRLGDVRSNVLIRRSDFEALIAGPVNETIAAVRRALVSAGVPLDSVSRVLLVGGSSRIPLVADVVARELGRPVAVDAHPKHSIALGAAQLAMAALRPGGASAPPAASASPPADLVGPPPLVGSGAPGTSMPGPPPMAAMPATPAPGPMTGPPPGFPGTAPPPSGAPIPPFAASNAPPPPGPPAGERRSDRTGPLLIAVGAIAIAVALVLLLVL